MPITIIINEKILNMSVGSLKQAMPIIETNKIPTPAQIAYKKLKSKYLRVIIKMLSEMPQKTNVRIEAYKLVNPFDSFIQIEAPSSDKMAIDRSTHRISVSFAAISSLWYLVPNLARVSLSDKKPHQLIGHDSRPK